MSELIVDSAVYNIPLTDINFDEGFNCRMQKILPIQVKTLVENIKETGLLQPVVVYECEAEELEANGYKYRLIVGFRRFKAHTLIPATEIRALVDNTLRDPYKAKLFNLTENLQRQDLNILEEATALQAIRDKGMDEYAIAKQVGMSRGWVQTRLLLLKLPTEVQHEAALGWINDSIIRDLYTICKKHGAEKACEKVKQIKESKQRGEKIKVIERKPSPFAKSKKDQKQIGAMMGIVSDVFGPGFALRALAWASGGISDYDFHCSIQVEANLLGKEYLIPYTEEDLVMGTTHII